MAQVILGGLGGLVGGGVGRVVGAALGGAIDRGVVGTLSPARQRGPRLEALKLQSTAEGAPMACAFGRARVTGQMIWAARFLETRHESGGGKGGPRTVDHAYSLSFAVAICEGPIDGVGRVWADGRLLDQSGVTMRVHRGTDDQTPDPLIEAVEGRAPAYRGTAYAVFEDLPLGPFGNRPPQLSFEIFRRPPGEGLEDRLEGVCLIPGAGEFALATEPVFRRAGLTTTVPENLHMGDGRTDLLVSLDQLQAQCPNLKRVSLVVGWFGDDLRAGHCRVRPGVERRIKPTFPLEWSVAGATRQTAHVISQVGERPAYGGTPSDQTVRQAVAALKARGWEVTLYPFVFMDIAANNVLPDPYGGARQAAHPWRGRIRAEDGAAATAEVASLFGSGDDWGLRRLALHYAGIAAETGCAGLIIGSEMRGLTWSRDADGGYPAVDQYRALAAECRAVVGADVALTYAADWSEYAGHRPDDGSGDVIFHLDPLWADDAIDHVGIDWYPPMGDWREGDGGFDGAVFGGPDDPSYLAAQVAGGEGFDWYYADEADRAAQARTPIVDTAHGEDWVFRVKDLVGWWSSAHHDRHGGVRSATPTAWSPGMKPIRLTEFGCAAVDRGGNAPNLFLDPKSSESRLPPFSTGSRDDRMQRRALGAILSHFDDPAHNPVSPAYAGRMLAAADAWCWDARPYPAFPALTEEWSDAAAWRTGHWLTGRLSGLATHLLAALLRRGGLSDEAFSVAEPPATVSGYVVDRPMRTRDAIEPLLAAFDMRGAERDGKIALIGAAPAVLTLAADDLAVPGDAVGPTRTRTLEARPAVARVRFIDEGADYQTGAVVLRADGANDGGAADVDLPAVCGPGLPRTMAARLLDGEAGERLGVALGPLDALRLEAGDTVAVEGTAGPWRVERLTLDETPTAELTPARSNVFGEDGVEWRPGRGQPPAGRPFVAILDLPPLPGAETDARPIAVVAAEPWRPMAVHVGEDIGLVRRRGVIDDPAVVGTLVEPLSPGAPHRWDEVGAVVVRLERGGMASVGAAGVLAGANLAAVQTDDGWELMQFRQAALIGETLWRLSGLLRGQQGTEMAAARGAGTGALFVPIDPQAGRFAMGPEEHGLPRVALVGPAGGPLSGPSVARLDFLHAGLHARPWAPAGLTVEAVPGGLDLRWIPRVRIGGDVWEREPVESDPRRFRLRVLDDGVLRRTQEVEALRWTYPDAAIAEDFPGGPDAGAVVAVAQYGPEFGWGVEARADLAV